MQASLRILAGACALLLTALTTSAQVFVGSDNFNDNTLTIQGANPQAAGQYRFTNPDANGTGNAWTEVNQRMEYTTSNTTGFNRGQLGWVSPSTSSNALGGAGLSTGAPYTSSWTASVEATNLLTSFTGGGFAAAGFEIYMNNATNTGSNAFYGLNVNNNASGQYIDFEWGRWNQSLNAGAGDFDHFQTLVATNDVSNIILRMTYDGATKVLVTDYSKDGGATYLAGASWDIDGAQAGISLPGANGFGLELYASAAQGYAINSGAIYFDNLSVSAIPEPSTYAAIAGACGLGLAAWHRRRKLA